MKTATSMKNLGLGLCVVAAGFMVGGCNTTKATVDTTVNFFSSTSPNGLFSADGMVLKEQKINLFAGVAYENLRQEAAAGGGQYVSALASLYEIPAARQGEFGQVLQRKHADLFAAALEEDRTAHLKMVSALNRELVAASLLP
ncbi:MAG TPA: DUF3015 family protein [Nitrospira sp.]|jgi:hypothetical protein|nr:DUF3015 family protein [Nitrospira sp.]MCC7214245.1 DUF3015 family protein [Nitrospira sp.]OYT23571.1 MAG: hypothetical protein CCU27_08595 [Nitrospira sp. UW-LDO-02]HNP80665.1 DUF3015 family protein [Nitrospira sp.]HNV32539.1 DUF3015 family protein [Nitrospira sp.]